MTGFLELDGLVKRFDSVLAVDRRVALARAG